MSTRDSTRALKEKHNAECGVFGAFGLINLVLQTVLFSCNLKRTISVVRKSAKMITDAIVNLVLSTELTM